MRSLALTLAVFLPSVALVTSTAWGQVVTECDWVANPANILEPWNQHSRTYANGAIRVAALDTGGEPVCCSAHLLVLSPSGSGLSEPAYRACHVVSAQRGMGFYSLDIAGISASYDPSRGLSLSVPVGHWHAGMDSGAGPILERLEVLINQASGSVSID